MATTPTTPEIPSALPDSVETPGSRRSPNRRSRVAWGPSEQRIIPSRDPIEIGFRAAFEERMDQMIKREQLEWEDSILLAQEYARDGKDLNLCFTYAYNRMSQEFSDNVKIALTALRTAVKFGLNEGERDVLLQAVNEALVVDSLVETNLVINYEAREEALDKDLDRQKGKQARKIALSRDVSRQKQKHAQRMELLMAKLQKQKEDRRSALSKAEAKNKAIVLRLAMRRKRRYHTELAALRAVVRGGRFSRAKRFGHSGHRIRY